MSQETNQQVVQDDVATIGPDPEADALLEKLQGMVVTFQRMIDCRSREALQQPGHDGHWGVVEILCYLRDWEMVIQERVRQIVDDDTPVFEDPDTTLWPLDHDYRAEDSHEVFHALAELRGSLVEHLREMPPGAWDRAGVFEGHGTVTLRAYLEQIVIHDQQYIDEAREAMA